MDQKKIRTVGLTGGIGAGKSSAAAYLKKKGFVHIDADEISRQLTVKGSPMLSVLNRIFGATGEMGKEGMEILEADGSLNRKALASLVFTDEKKKQRLDQLMFGAIIQEIDSRIEGVRLGKEMIFRRETEQEEDPAGILLDAPLLFESGLDSRCDLVMLMVAEEDVRIERVCRRDGVTVAEVRNRINSQMSDEEKRKRADIVLDNSGNQQQLERKLETFFAKFSKNSCNRFRQVL